LNHDSPKATYDLVCGAGCIEHAAALDRSRTPKLQALPGVSLATLEAHLQRGIYALDHALDRDSLYRVWRRMARGYVPAGTAEHRTPEPALFPTLMAYILADGPQDLWSVRLRISNFLARAHKDLPVGQAVALLANGILWMQAHVPVGDDDHTEYMRD